MPPFFVIILGWINQACGTKQSVVTFRSREYIVLHGTHSYLIANFAGSMDHHIQPALSHLLFWHHFPASLCHPAAASWRGHCSEPAVCCSCPSHGLTFLTFGQTFVPWTETCCNWLGSVMGCQTFAQTPEGWDNGNYLCQWKLSPGVRSEATSEGYTLILVFKSPGTRHVKKRVRVL